MTREASTSSQGSGNETVSNQLSRKRDGLRGRVSGKHLLSRKCWSGWWNPRVGFAFVRANCGARVWIRPISEKNFNCSGREFERQGGLRNEISGLRPWPGPCVLFWGTVRQLPSQCLPRQDPQRVLGKFMSGVTPWWPRIQSWNKKDYGPFHSLLCGQDSGRSGLSWLYFDTNLCF